MTERRTPPDRVWSRTTRTMAELLGRQITLARRRRGWTERDLATRARLSRPTIAKIERGKGSVLLDALLEVCRLLEVPLLGVTDLRDVEALLRRVEADLGPTTGRVRPRRIKVSSGAFRRCPGTPPRSSARLVASTLNRRAHVGR